MRDDQPKDAVSVSQAQEVGLLDLALLLAQHARLLILGPLVAGLAALGITYLIAPTFTASTTFLPPPAQQSSAMSALASLGALSGLAGAAGSAKSTADQYLALMKSVTVADRLIDQFKLMDVYDVKYRADARKALALNVQLTLGKKDGLITVEVDDTDPQRAADLANQHVAELRKLTAGLALTEAQQRRVFFDGQLKQTQAQLTSAQLALQNSGFNAGALKAEPRSAAEGYARLQAEATAAEVRLQTLRRGLADNTPEIQQQLGMLAALRAQLSKAETPADPASGPDYISKYREFKYQEALFEMFSRQYELARVDESRDGTLIQVVDLAMPPERKSKPKRVFTALAVTIATLLLLTVFVTVRHYWRESASQSDNATKLARLRAALGKD